MSDGHGENEPSCVSAIGEENSYAVDGVENNTAQQTDIGVPGTTAVASRPRRKRGRHPKDPLGQTVRFQCSRLEDLEANLREYLANPVHPAEHTTLEFSFPVTAAFLIPAREALGTADPGDKMTPFTYSLFKKSAVSVVDALHNIPDPKEQMITQKRISKSLVEAISEIDGFRYSFHNNWLSNADQANRFSYYCNDSILNKGRAANEGLAKIRGGVKSRKPVYECEGGIWIKFSLTKNNLQLDYKHIPIHPTFEETAPLPRNGSKRRKLWEIFHPEKLPQNRGRFAKDKSNPQEKARKRKSTDDPKTPGRRKRRATEPASQCNDLSTPQSTQHRENSLQPLFDFLGSADRLEDADGAVPETESLVDCNGGSAPPALGADAEDVPEIESTAPSGNKDKTHPGTMSGSMTNEDLTRGKKTRPKKKGSKRSTEQPPGESATAPIPPTAVTSQPAPAAMQQANGPAPASASSDEIDALRRRLLEAEEKIRQLEGQKQQEPQPPQPPQPAQPVTIMQQPPLPPPAPQAQYAPPQYSNHAAPAPPGQWQYPPYPPYQYPAPGSSHPPLSPPPVPAATLPQPYYQAKQNLPLPVQPNPSPSYGFVPNPAELFATNIRPQLVPSPSQSVPGPAPPTLHRQHNNAAPPLPAQSPAPSQSQGQSHPSSSAQSQPQTPVAGTNRPIAPYPHTAVEQQGVQARPPSEAQPQAPKA
ncbi:hypothetical protein G647_06560 [Cladophialophora carrionii CBS 160.54]|uniref:Uncharacterized protein n=1 Tax=Cladophialophora carrionii CBS 160.54 TaxID=1279043 RepID=V9D6I7_9EURO|nr:uncharacterized protein G647_06560 [Cladophialophora carrionii CBS 160.54]ETI22485.1 hypothetical protein G647_06560 [Cladophialophora carrionii CBS 160.54]